MPGRSEDRECRALLQWALPRMGLRWRGFSRLRGQVCKRIARRMKELGLADVAAYQERLLSDPSEWRRLDGYCRITISRFHRDRAVYEALREDLLPPLLRAAQEAGRPFRAWSAGCASGEEPYTLALLLRLGLGQRLSFQIVATDADEGLLQRAQGACYPHSSLAELPRDWVTQAFSRQDEELCLHPAFREGVNFLCQDLREDAPAGPFDIVLCRNLAFTYFDLPLQRRVLTVLLERLAPEGLLLIGAHEALPPEAIQLHHLEKPAGALPIFRRLLKAQG